MRRFVVYSRLSTDKQGRSGLGLEAHKTDSIVTFRSTAPRLLNSLRSSPARSTRTVRPC